MGVGQSRPAFQPVRHERRETWSERIPGFWAFVGLIAVLAAIAVHSKLLKDWEPADRPEITGQAVRPDEQVPRERLRARLDAQIEQTGQPGAKEGLPRTR